jgi:hypothetical protein
MARLRSAEREALHGPWPADYGDAQQRTALKKQHPGWQIWRALDDDQTPGDWCAVSTGPAGGTQLTAASPEELSALITREAR